MHEYFKSLREWAKPTVGVWVFLIPGLLAGGITVAQAIHPFGVPSRVTIAVAIAALFVGSFMAFHRVRLERDSRLRDDERNVAAARRPVIYRDRISRLLDEFSHVDPNQDPDTALGLADRADALLREARGDGIADDIKRHAYPGRTVSGTRFRELLEQELRGADGAKFRDDYDPT